MGVANPFHIHSRKHPPTDAQAPETSAPDERVRRESWFRHLLTRPEFAAAGGGVGGYDRGWLDPGSHIMRVHGEPRTSILTTTNGRLPPFKAGVARPAGGRGGGGLGSFDNPENRSPGERCILSFGRNAGPPMLANGFYNNNYNIVQTKDEVAIVVEMVHDVRHVRLNARHLPASIKLWMGDSIGWWEGDTLVVETTNFRPEQGLFGRNINQKVTERFTRIGPHKIDYKFKLEDPGVYEAPIEGELALNTQKGMIYEYACHEGNYAMHSILAGAREAEKEGKPYDYAGGAGGEGN